MGVASGYSCKEVYRFHEGQQGASNYVQRHLILSGSDTFLIWTFPQAGNLPLWWLRIRVKQAQRTACRRAHRAHPTFPRARWEFAHS